MLDALTNLEPMEKAAGEASPVEVAVTVAMVKAGTISTDVAPATNARPSEYEQLQAFLAAGALLPPYDPWQLSRLYERSSVLRPNISAYETNIAGFGFQLEPVIDLEAGGANEAIAKALRQEALATGQPDYTPSPEAIADARARIEREMFAERFKLDRFFASCAPLAPGRSLMQLRKETIVDEEVTGNAYWEVIRRNDGRVCHFNWVDSRSMRLRAIQLKMHDVAVPERASPFRYEDVIIKRRFRSFVQVVLGVETVFFKEFGDPRVMSSKTSHYYASLDKLYESEGADALAATEIIHWATFSPIAPYGVPRWIGAQYQVLGALASEQVNYDYFDNKAIPDFAVLVSGGKLKDGAEEKIKDYLKANKGRENFHATLVLEADGAGASTEASRCKIEIQPLREKMAQDALFQEYEANCAKKVQQQFRLPDLLVGRSQEANRAQAEAALQMAEQQVIQPRRHDFDEVMNNLVLADARILWWRFQTNSAVAKDPELQTKLGTDWVKAGVLTPQQGLDIAGEVFNRDFPAIDDGWGKQPLPLTLAGIIPGSSLAPSAGGDGGAPPPLPPGAAASAAPAPRLPQNVGEQKSSLGGDVATRMLILAQQLRDGASDTHAVAMASVRGNAAAQVLKVPNALFKDWFAGDDPPPIAGDDGDTEKR